MKKEAAAYLEIGRKLKEAQESQMFGKPCFKIKGKAFISLFDNEMVFKLTGEVHRDALSLDGTRQFDPSGKKRPMKEWVQVPYDYVDKWAEFAKEALNYVGSETT
ncbi:TfoX/Sxy family protein [Fluviicola chungangensis]|nr:TfoX/Sxy family protein [Fluviicola chungangensis]